MYKEFFESFILVFVAEMGDKTQLMLMTLAAKYSVIQVLSGILAGVLLNHGLAVYVGSFISDMTNEYLLQLLAGLIFIVFGIITLVFENGDENQREYGLSPVITTALTFFIGEMGDKTQLSCMTLSMDALYPMIVLAGSVSAMLTIGLIGIIIGTSLTKFLPSYIIKTISGLVFIIFGTMRLII
jgi:putative Ca2+/H+ antiporter (TMEM165/GDT1 family)